MNHNTQNLLHSIKVPLEVKFMTTNAYSRKKDMLQIHNPSFEHREGE